MHQDKIIKKLLLWFLGILALNCFLFYRMGQQDAKNEIQHEYPYLLNVQDVEASAHPDGTIWLTHNPTRDTFAVNVCRGGRYEKVYVWPEN